MPTCQGFLGHVEVNIQFLSVPTRYAKLLVGGADRKYPLSSILEPNCHTESPIGMAFIDRDAGDSISAKQE